MVRTVVQLEDDYVDRVFRLAPEGIEGITPDEVKKYVRYRANCKLVDIGLSKNWKSQGDDSGLPWADVIIGGVNHTDFFSQKVDSYSKGAVSFDKLRW
jgi:ribonucleoside-diphosphate reductase beta chain